MVPNDPLREAVIVAAVRTPVGKARRGGLATVRPDEMAAVVLKELVARCPSLNLQDVDDVILGCAFPEGEQGMNIARMSALRAGFPVSVPGETINRFCSSGLQSIAHAVQAIQAGEAEIVLAGGTESMSMVPMTGFKFSPNPKLAFEAPEVFTNMGLTAENLAEKYRISRQEQDEFALRSHQRAVRALENGLFDEEIVPIEVNITEIDASGKLTTRCVTFQLDDGPRADTSLQALGKLKPAFKEGGTVTAGNSSQMSDGAAGVVVMSRERAQALGCKPIARLISYAVAGVEPDLMGIGPVKAVPKALRRANLKLEDIELIELNEAFAAQSLAVIRELGLNEEITNVNGGAIALGHPLGCTGAKLTTQLLYEMKRGNARYGMVTMCIGGGMGAAGIFENLTMGGSAA